MHPVAVFIELNLDKANFDLCIYVTVLGREGFFACLFSPYDSVQPPFLKRLQLNDCSSFKEKVWQC